MGIGFRGARVSVFALLVSGVFNASTEDAVGQTAQADGTSNAVVTRQEPPAVQTSVSEEPTPPTVEETGSAEDPENDEPEDEKGLSIRFKPFVDPVFPLALTDDAKATVDRFASDDDLLLQSIQLIEVPLKRNLVSLDEESANLWVKGDRPENNLLAKLSMSPVETVSVVVNESQSMNLHRANRLRTYGVSQKAPDSLVTDSDIYCGAIKANGFTALKTPICLHDSDEDGAFDRISPALSESRGEVNPLAVSVMWPSLALQTPLPFADVASEQVPTLPLNLINCAKDWDRPRFQFVTNRPKQDPDEVEVQSMLSEIVDDRELTDAQIRLFETLIRNRLGRGSEVGTACYRGEPLEAYNGQSAKSYGKGHRLASLSGITISIGRKKDGAPVKLLGDNGGSVEYRWESGSLARTQSGLSELQKPLATRQKFERLPYTATGPVEMRASTNGGSGDIVLFALPFHYGYRARLTEKESIRTLLTSRSLESGMEFYGVPMRTSRQTTYNGVPIGLGNRPAGPSRTIDTSMNWCTTIKHRNYDWQVAEGKPRNHYDATCFSQIGEQYSIVKGNKPAYAITSMRHEANISTNDGKPALEMLGPGNFGEPLTLRYRVAESGKNGFLRLHQDLYVGEKLTNSRLILLSSSDDGAFTYRNAGATLRIESNELTKGEVPQVTVELVKQTKEGEPINFNQSTRSFPWSQ